MERTEYAAMLPALAPGQAVDILNERVHHVGRLNSEISDWLAERRRLEELYANGLRKLARRPVQGLDLGIFSVPWTTVMGATDTQADSHASLASKIEVDVERPLRDYVKQSREVQAMSSMQGNLNALARDVETAQQKLEKLQSRGESNKLASANSDLEQAQGQWDSQASYVFENLQALDEARWSNLRDVFTQLHTHEVDQIEKDRVSAEQCLNVLLNVEIADEIKTFSLKAVASRPQRSERPTRQPSLPVPSPGLIAQATSSRPNLAPTLSQTSERSSQDDEKKDKKGPLRSLKRFSTVMGRKKDRSSKLPSQLEPMAENPEPKGKSSLFGRRGKKEEAPSIEPPPTSSTQRPYSPLRVGSEAFEPAALRETPAAATPPTGYSNGLNGVAEGAAIGAGIGGSAAALQRLNGHSGDLADLEPPQSIHAAVQAAPSSPALSQTTYASQAPPASSQPPAQSSFASQAPAQPSFASQAPAQSSFASQPPAPALQQRDSEGYSVPSNEIDAITRAQQEAAGASDNAALSYNVNIRDAPIAEDKGVDANAALASVQSKLLQQQAPPPQRRAGTVRGRRDNRNSAYYGPADIPVVAPTAELPRTAEATPTTSSFEPSASTASNVNAALPPPTSNVNAPLPPPPAFNPSASTSSAFSTLPAAQEAPSPFKPVSRNLTSDSAADNQSIRSGKSLSSTTSQGNKHPELNGVGLNASILETISARFENGKSAGSSLVGEIALAYHAPDFSTPFGTENIKLENFSLLDKVAPNPAIITPSAAGRDGEYSVNLTTLGKTQLVLKYQARSEDTSAHAPLLITPAFKIEATQASVIVNYSLSPSFVLPTGHDSITLSNVMLALTPEGAKATSCQSKPVGTFSKEKNMIFWQLGDITLRPGAGPEKLLARFATESEAKAGSVEARWEITGEKAVALGSGLAVSVQQTTGATDGADPFADESGPAGAAQWKAVNTVKKLASGNYSAR